MGDAELFERYADELRTVPNLRIVPLDAETAIHAAWGRSGGRDLGDAVHVASARRAGVEIIQLSAVTLEAPADGARHGN